MNDDIQDLLFRMREDSLTNGEMSALTNRLRGDVEARRGLVAGGLLTAGIVRHLAREKTSPRRVRRTRRTALLTWGIAVAAALVLAIGLRLTKTFHDDVPSAAWIAELSGPASGCRVHGLDGRVRGAEKDMALAAGDRIETGEAARVSLRFRRDRSTVTVEEHTTVVVGPGSEMKHLRLTSGALEVRTIPSSGEEGLVIETAQGRVRAMGTWFRTSVRDNLTRVEVVEGIVELARAKNEQAVWITAGQYVTAGDERPLAVTPLADTVDVRTTRAAVLALAARVADRALYGVPENKDGPGLRDGVWQDDMLMAGVLALWRETGRDNYLRQVRNWAEQEMRSNPVPTWQGSFHGYVLLTLYAHDQRAELLEYVGPFCEFLAKDAGIFAAKGAYEQFDADPLMAAPLLARYGTIANNPRYVEAAVALFLQHVERFENKRRSLFWQRPERRSVFQACGNGSLMACAVELLDTLPVDYPRRDEILEVFRRTMKELCVNQTATGMWRSGIRNREFLNAEAGGSALILYAMAKGMKGGWLGSEYLPRALRAWRGLEGMVLPSGVVVGIQRPTNVPEPGPYPIYPPGSGRYINHGIGALLLAASEIARFPAEWLALEGHPQDRREEE